MNASVIVPSDHTSQATGLFWERLLTPNGGWKSKDYPPGADLAALRRGVGQEPGSVPQMWRYYTRLNAQGHQTAALEAEHLALTLFAIHQQSKAKPMHRVGDGLGTAVLALRNDSSSSPEAVDRRFAAAATATSLAEIGMHLRGLISQLRRIDQPLDYTLLMRDLAGWQDPDRRARTRRRWGGQYFAGRKDETDDSVSDAD